VTALASRRRNRTLLALAAGLLVLVTMPVLGVAAWRALRDSTAGENVGVIETLAIPPTPAALFGTVDESGELTTLSVLTRVPTGGGGNIVSVPVGAKSELSLDGTVSRVADAYVTGGLDALLLEMESLMNITFSSAAVYDEAQLAAALAPVGDVSVALEDDVLDADLSGLAEGDDPEDAPVDTVVEAGAVTLTPAEVAAVLTARVPDELESERLPRTLVVWEGLKAAVGNGVGPVPADATSGTGVPFDQFLTAFLGGPVNVWQLAYEYVDPSDDNPNGLDLYLTDKAEILLVMASVAPSAVSASNPGLSVQIDSPFGDSNITKQAVALIAYVGGNVIIVREVDQPIGPVTVAYFADASDADDAVLFSNLIGEIEMQQVDQRVEGVDVQLVLGQSFVDFLGSAQQVTTTSAAPTTVAPTDPSSPTTEGE
jgi:hypothetical protein